MTLREVRLWILADKDEPISARVPRDAPGIQYYQAETEAELDAAPFSPQAIYACTGRALLKAAFLRAPDLEWVHSQWAGVEHLLFPELVSSHIPLTNTRSAYGGSLAEFVLASILYFEKNIPGLIAARGKWQHVPMEDVQGKTAVIVGYGDIGREVARRLRPLGIKVIGVRRSASSQVEPEADEVCASNALLQALAQADYVVLALPSTPGTQNFIGHNEFAAMRGQAILVNIGRGNTLDEIALIKALSSGKIRGAALDVFATEPLPTDHPLYNMHNVLVSPHCADRVRGWEDAPAKVFVENLLRFQRGESLHHIVNKTLGY